MELKIENLSKTYSNGVNALKDITLTIPQGMFGLLGPNGAGKSSLMRTMATLQQADSGSITMGDIDILKDTDKVREMLGYLPQEFGVYPKVTSYKMLDHIASLKGVSNKGERKELVEALLNKTNLWHVRNKSLGTYSGGMKQRFGIAQALIGSPKLIIVDEPTAGLDPAERVRFHNLLSEIGENTIIILSTHIVDDVANLCKNMAIICLGEVVAQGNPTELIQRVQGKIWKKMIDKKELDNYKSNFQVISTHLKAGSTVIHVYNETRPDETFEPSPANLEDVYFTEIAARLNEVTV
ncbi:ABC transporter ATP-binding protein [Maribacter arcticus]|jgi:ABC-2 type transport system ATP-binding protein|uniref:ABC-type multidrug transport system, ATPase component n=1 Tax=Maribacter arcticus TaxID=561365 RepID=A0A1T5A6K1_9FLAO|nr:ABC transporter ATP-binding protein [Maribacter arcticus]SKB30614.1 ABC-type multidrug transport system, ATPase component [Maribacter arcticus]|tara:strand:- start:37 stop:924 length:888 start_codon:yes stop_codon:yes gene_type:complete